MNFTIIAVGDGGRLYALDLIELLRRWIIEISPGLMLISTRFSDRAYQVIDLLISSFWTGMPLISRQSRRPYCSSSLILSDICSDWFCRYQRLDYFSAIHFLSVTRNLSLPYSAALSAAHRIEPTDKFYRFDIFSPRGFNFLSRILSMDISVVASESIAILYT